MESQPGSGPGERAGGYAGDAAGRHAGAPPDAIRDDMQRGHPSLARRYAGALLGAIPRRERRRTRSDSR